MKQFSRLILLFSLVFAVFFVGPPLLNKPFGFFPLMRTGEVLDLLTPVVLLPLYWLLYQRDSVKPVSLRGSIIFLILAMFWVEGQGMHLSANSIGHLLTAMKGGEAYLLTYFYDEQLSHYLWHLGVVGLSALLIFRQWQDPFVKERAGLWLESVAGIIYGFAFFLLVIEGGTTALGIPFAVLVTVFGLGWGWGRNQLRQQPLLAFFFVSYLLATLLFASWGIYWGGFPQFSEVGLLS
jgi:hypothetical protein